ncbi:peptidoglycan-recognition protein LD isoform X1 [Drosophila santomea]|uniref:peptidoglycan-recognition protein LD isoform X1 n=1 Tax=Drosophila santomea TaxID=129105 RepID=UPI0019538329|nr:peptidoglycan-recognition protein LD isoform X1 [Drosophila santomea]
MPIFVSAYSLRAISKYYAHQDQSGLDKLCHLTNHLVAFISAKLHNVLFALYFATIARRSPSPAAVSQSTYGSLEAIPDIHIRVNKDCDASESTPLLAAAQRSTNTPSSHTASSSPALSSCNPTHQHDCINWRSVGLLVMCASALALAAYLLWRQTQAPDFGYRLSLIGHDIWSDVDLQGRGTLLEPISVCTVIFTHTEGNGCHDDCPDVLRELERSHLGQLPYNFLVAGDCQVFEAQGWHYRSQIPRDLPGKDSLVVAFVGNFSGRAPIACQLMAAQALILESLKRRTLQQEYQLYVMGSRTDALQRELRHWPHYANHQTAK